MTTSPARKRRKRAFVALLFLILILCLPLLFADALLGFALIQIFARGTGCDVHLRSPQVSFFPLRASVKDVVIRAPQERSDEGFFADTISLEIIGSELLKRRVVLTNFVIDGAQANSHSEESAFFRTLEFILKDDTPDEEPPPLLEPGAPSPEWDFFITDLTVVGRGDTAATPPRFSLAAPSTPPPRPLPALRIKQSGFVFDWSDLVFRLVRSPIHTPPVFATEASAPNFFIERDGVRRELRELQLGGEIRAGVVQFQQIVAKVGSTPDLVTGQGEIRTRGEGEYQIAVRTALHNGALQEVLGGLFPHLEGEARVEGVVSGELLNPVLTGELALHSPPGFAVTSRCKLHTIQSKFRLDEEVFSFTDLGSEEFGRITALKVQLQDSFPITGELAVSGGPRELLRCLLPGEPQESSVQSSLRGTFQPLALQGSFSSELRFASELRSNLRGEFYYSPERIGVNFLQGEKTPTEERRIVEGEAEYLSATKTLELSRLQLNRCSAASALTVAELLLPAAREQTERLKRFLTPTSSLSGSGRLSLSLSDLSGAGAGTVEVQNIVILGAPAPLLRGAFSADQSGVRIEELRLQTAGGEVLGKVGVTRELGLSGELSGRAIALAPFESVRHLLPVEAESVDLHATLAGKVERPHLDLGLAIRHREQILSEAKFTGDAQKGEFQGSLFGPALTVRGEWSGQRVKVQGRALQLALNRFPVFLARFPDAEGSVTAELAYSATLGKPWAGEGEVTLQKVLLQGPTLTVDQPALLQWRIAGGKLLFGETRFLINNHPVSLRGALSSEKGWSAQVKGRYPLQLLVPPLPSVEQVAGDLDVDLELSGPLAAPLVKGPLKVHDAALSLRAGQTIVGINDLSAAGVLTGADLEVQEITAQTGEGEMRGSGVIRSIFSAAERNGSVTLRFNGFTFEPLPRLVASLEGELSGEFRPGRLPLLRGEIRILEALYEDRITLPAIIRAVTRTVSGLNARERYGERAAESERRGGDGGALDVRLRAENTVLVDTDVVKTSLSADLAVTGTTYRPVVNGSISSEGGTFGFGSRKFDVVTGSVVFLERDPRVDPRLDIVGETDVQGGGVDPQRIRLVVGGRLSQPKVSLFSDRGLREQEILAVLGATPGEATEVSLFQAGRSPKGLLERTVTGLTGLSSVEVSYGLSSTTGSFVPKVTATRPLGGKITARLKSELAKEQTSSASIEYPLNSEFDLITSWKNAPTVANPQSSTGSFDIGVRYQNTYPGLRILPPNLLKQREEGR